MVATLFVTRLYVGARRELCAVQLHFPSKNRIDEKSGFVGTLKIGAFGGIVEIAAGAGAIALGAVVWAPAALALSAIVAATEKTRRPLITGCPSEQKTTLVRNSVGLPCRTDAGSSRH
jgi:hypothetical protein